MQLYSILPLMFIVVAIVGTLLCLLGLRGLLTGVVYAPSLRNTSLIKSWVKLAGGNGKPWAIIEIVAGAGLVLAMSAGLSLYAEFRNSPAFFDSLLPPPGEKQVLYASFSNDLLETIFTFDLDPEQVRRHYLDELHGSGWNISGKPETATISAAKDAMTLELIVIGRQSADQKDYRCKVIVSLRFR